MKATSYTLVLSDGLKIVRTHQSAGEAIEAARREFRNRCVVSCHSGLTEEEAQSLRENGLAPRAVAGMINFVVPEHSAYDDRAVFATKGRKIDATQPMFSEDDIKAESEAALNRRRV